ncbi:hypothetical protein FB451DRAFT_1398381 [Mycena latifolia]|nr:hypothetical protein FB451DRAFT_1398381 [Mycena latifolia]
MSTDPPLASFGATIRANCHHRIATLDFSANTALEHLKISEALRFNVIEARDQFDVTVCPALEHLLSGIMLYARVQMLILKVRTYPAVVMHTVEFIVDGSSLCLNDSVNVRLAREYLKPILDAVIPGSNRQIVCSDGEDPDEIFY